MIKESNKALNMENSKQIQQNVLITDTDKDEQEEQFYSMVSDDNLIWQLDNDDLSFGQKKKMYRNTFSQKSETLKEETNFKIIPPDRAFEELESEKIKQIKVDAQLKPQERIQKKQVIVQVQEQKVKQAEFPSFKKDKLIVQQPQIISCEKIQSTLDQQDTILLQNKLQLTLEESKLNLFEQNSQEKRLSKNIKGKLLFRQERVVEYRKMEYQLTFQSLVIAGLNEQISLRKIQRIKIIGNSILKPQMKLVYKSKINKEKQRGIYLCASFNDIYILFAGIIVRKMHQMSFKFYQQLIPIVNQKPKAPQIEGYLFKRSKHLKKWMKRRVIIDECLKSYKDKKCTLAINKIHEIWTKFQIHNGFLVFRVNHHVDQTLFGIPISNYMNTLSEDNWLYALCYLLLIDD